MCEMENYFQQIQSYYFENNIWTWLSLVLISVFATFIVKLILHYLSKYLRKFAQKTASIWDDVFIDLIDGSNRSIIFISLFFFFTQPLSRSTSFGKLLSSIAIIAIIFQFALWGLHIIKNWRKAVLDKKIAQNPSSSAALGLLYTAIQLGFIVLLILIGLSHLGIDITALLAGLGVGGIAVALAAQNILGDLLASLSIVLDKPFVVGDYIVAGNEKGTVEHIGIKTTRLRSLSGEELILSNKDLLESRVQNFKRMWVRRVVQNFGLTYSTSAETIEKVPQWVQSIVEKQSKLRFDRCHFAAYGSSSLDFELVFYVSDSEYNVYMDLQQIVLLDIFKKFTEERVEFAFPSQSIYVAKLPTPV